MAFSGQHLRSTHFDGARRVSDDMVEESLSSYALRNE